MRRHCAVVTASLFLLVSSSALPSAGQTVPSPPQTFPPQLVQQLIALRDAALSDDYAYQVVSHLTDNIGPRSTGSLQAQAAVEYIAAELKRLGLEVQLEPVQVPTWIRGADAAELVDYAARPSKVMQKIVVTALGGNAPTPAEGITADVVVVKNFDELQGLGRDVANKIVLFNVPFDKKKAAAGKALEAYGDAVQYRGKGPKAAADLGAVAALVRSVGGADYRLPHTGYSAPAGIPAGAVTSEDADLISHLAAQGRVRMHLVLTTHNGPMVTSYNVIGDLKGTDHPEQVVVVSGHLDSWDLGTGAIDDAAGVGVAVSVAKLVQQLQLHPKRTIRVIAWMDEENGGRGHERYAKDHSADFANHTAAIESDLGADRPLAFGARVKPEVVTLLEPVHQVLKPIGDIGFILTTSSPGSDIEPLAKAGVPSFGVLQDGRTYFDYHHSPADTLDKIDPRQLQENAAAMAVLGYAIAALDQPLPR